MEWQLQVINWKKERGGEDQGYSQERKKKQNKELLFKAINAPKQTVFEGGSKYLFSINSNTSGLFHLAHALHIFSHQLANKFSIQVNSFRKKKEVQCQLRDWPIKIWFINVNSHEVQALEIVITQPWLIALLIWARHSIHRFKKAAKNELAMELASLHPVKVPGDWRLPLVYPQVVHMPFFVEGGNWEWANRK